MKISPEKKRQYNLTYKTKNKEKYNEYRKNWGRKNRHLTAAQHRRWVGLPEPTRPAPSVCECCGGSFNKTPSLDHCHTTNKFRGWLCNSCNIGIGNLGDSIDGVAKALAYLTKTAGTF